MNIQWYILLKSHCAFWHYYISNYITSDCNLQLLKLNVVIAGIIILQINHLSISETGEFTKQKVDKLMVFCGKHYQISVQRLWFTLVILPSVNMLSQTLQKTSNFSIRVSVSVSMHFDITRIIFCLELIMKKVKQ